MQPLMGIKIGYFTSQPGVPLATHSLSRTGANILIGENSKCMDYVRNGIELEDSDTMFKQANHNLTSLIVDYNAEKMEINNFLIVLNNMMHS